MWSSNQIAITCICFSQDDDDGCSNNDMCINIFYVILSAYTHWSTCQGTFSSFGLWQMIKKWEMMGISLVHFAAHFLERKAKSHHHTTLSHSQMRKNEFPDSYIINYPCLGWLKCISPSVIEPFRSLVQRVKLEKWY